MAKHFRWKVRPKKEPLFIPCIPEMTALLSCFASSSDLRATETCALAARTLHTCMGSVSHNGFGGKKKASSINHLLGKVSGGGR